MNRYEEGNLARRLSADSLPYNVPLPGVETLEETKRRKEERRSRLEYDSSVRDAYRQAGKARSKITLRLFAVFLALSVSAGLIAYRSAKIVELSFHNTGLKRQIGEYEKQNSLLQDRVSGKTSLQAVEQRAVNALGMQKAAADAMIHVGKTGTYADASAYGGSHVLSSRDTADNSEIIERWVRQQ